MPAGFSAHHVQKHGTKGKRLVIFCSLLPSQRLFIACLEYIYRYTIYSSSFKRTTMALQVNEQARKEANLRLLQRSMDRSISNILGSATHVVLYQFQQSSQSWEKSNVEGSLFLAVRPSGYLLVILNRNSPDNYPIPLSEDFQLQHKDPYLIFKQRQSESNSTVIRGIWFPNPNERILMNDLLIQVLTSLKNNSNPDPSSLPPTTPTTTTTTTTTTPASYASVAAPAAAVDPGAAIEALLSPMTLGGADSNSTPTMSSSTTPVRQASPSQQGNQPMLDKKSLQLALLSLIQDERFLDLLHAQYLKVAHARASRNNGNNNQNSS
jgi:mRNA-decapping enzyme 1B